MNSLLRLVLARFKCSQSSMNVSYATSGWLQDLAVYWVSLSDLCMVRGGAVQAGILSGVYHDLLLLDAAPATIILVPSAAELLPGDKGAYPDLTLDGGTSVPHFLSAVFRIDLANNNRFKVDIFDRGAGATRRLLQIEMNDLSAPDGRYLDIECTMRLDHRANTLNCFARQAE